jgi:hypothetical protein
MGFFHEVSIIYIIVPAFKNTFPKMRVLQFTELAKFAFVTGQ